MSKKKVKDIAWVTIPFRWSITPGCKDADEVEKDNKIGVEALAQRIHEGFEVKHMSTAQMSCSGGHILYSHYYLERI